MSKSLQFLINSIRHLGLSKGLRYWQIYKACEKDPGLVKRWEQVCRWESTKLEESDPAHSQMLENWANELKHR